MEIFRLEKFPLYSIKNFKISHFDPAGFREKSCSQFFDGNYPWVIYYNNPFPTSNHFEHFLTTFCQIILYAKFIIVGPNIKNRRKSNYIYYYYSYFLVLYTHKNFKLTVSCSWWMRQLSLESFSQGVEPDLNPSPRKPTVRSLLYKSV